MKTLKNSCLKYVSELLVCNSVEWSKHAVNLLPTDLNDELRHDLNKAQQMQIFGDYHLPFIRREKRPDGGFVIEIYILNQQYRKVLKERSEFDDRGQRNGSRIVIFNNCGTYLESIYCHGTQMMECIRRVRDHEILENRRPQQDAWITIS